MCKNFHVRFFES